MRCACAQQRMLRATGQSARGCCSCSWTHAPAQHCCEAPGAACHLGPAAVTGSNMQHYVVLPVYLASKYTATQGIDALAQHCCGVHCMACDQLAAQALSMKHRI
jgi:hypothetical protein